MGLKDDQLSKNHATFLHSCSCSCSTSSISSPEGNVCGGKCGFRWPKFMVIGHRGSGMNLLQSPDPKMKFLKENSILSINAAASDFSLEFVEFDVQVTKDDCPVIFHDNFIQTRDKGVVVEKRVTDMTEAEFLSYGPQTEKPLFRKTKDGRIFEWKVEKDDPLCTLQEAFRKVNPSLGFNIELKFDDDMIYEKENLTRVIRVILKVVHEHSNNRAIMFSTFQPDAVQLVRKLQNTYPVFFITNGGSEIKEDVRRNSLDEAIKMCRECGLQGIVSEVKAFFKNPEAVARIKESKLSLLTYGQLNNVPEVVYKQYMTGVEGVIVDLVRDIAEAVSDFIDKDGGKQKKSITPKPESEFSFLLQHELLFLQNLMPELVLS